MDTIRTELINVYQHAGQTLATVYLPSPSAIEDAEHRLDIRKKNVLADLERAGANSQILDHLRGALDGLDHDAGPAHTFVIGDEGVVFSREMDRPITRSAVSLASTPQLLPLLAATQVDRRHLAVLLDRSGADVMERDGVGAALDQLEIEGSGVRLHRSAPGGWSQKRFQQTAENNWENNAREVVEQIVEAYPDTDLLICGGDVRAVGFFKDHLPARIECHEVDGSRHADADAFLDEADVTLRTLAASHIVELLDRWQTASSARNGSTGVDALDHLAHGRVEHLLVVDDSDEDDRPTSWFDFSDHTHHREATEAAVEAPITDAAITLALATGAQVTVIPKHPAVEGGVAAMLRY